VGLFTIPNRLQRQDGRHARVDRVRGPLRTGGLEQAIVARTVVAGHNERVGAERTGVLAQAMPPALLHDDVRGHVKRIAG